MFPITLIVLLNVNIFLFQNVLKTKKCDLSGVLKKSSGLRWIYLKRYLSICISISIFYLVIAFITGSGFIWPIIPMIPLFLIGLVWMIINKVIK